MTFFSHSNNYKRKRDRSGARETTETNAEDEFQAKRDTKRRETPTHVPLQKHPVEKGFPVVACLSFSTQLDTYSHANMEFDRRREEKKGKARNRPSWICAQPDGFSYALALRY